MAACIWWFFFWLLKIPDREYLVRCCYMEIYNEKVSDLLSSEDKIIKIQEDTVRLFIYVSFFIIKYITTLSFQLKKLSWNDFVVEKVYLWLLKIR